MLREPWSDIGRLQTEIRDLQSRLGQFAESYELSQLRSDILSIENENSRLRGELETAQYEISTLQTDMSQLYEQLEESHETKDI